jgi:hypothetical protein
MPGRMKLGLWLGGRGLGCDQEVPVKCWKV